jgi:hypothetical protein
MTSASPSAACCDFRGSLDVLAEVDLHGLAKSQACRIGGGVAQLVTCAVSPLRRRFFGTSLRLLLLEGQRSCVVRPNGQVGAGTLRWKSARPPAKAYGRRES